jgi:hypothetical protein
MGTGDRHLEKRSKRPPFLMHLEHDQPLGGNGLAHPAATGTEHRTGMVGVARSASKSARNARRVPSARDVEAVAGTSAEPGNSGISQRARTGFIAKDGLAIPDDALVSMSQL